MTVDEEIVVFHYCLGVAITQWSSVEKALCNIVVTCFKNEHVNRESIAIGFFSLEGFRAKLDFSDGVVSRKLAGQIHRDDWRKLADKARTLSRQRNKLAHWSMNKYVQSAPGRRLALIAWVGPKAKKKTKVPRPPNGSLCIRDIKKLGMDYFALACSLDNFLARACKQIEPHPKSSEQAGNPPTILMLTRQILEVLSAQHQSSAEKP